MLVLLWNKGASRLANWLVNVQRLTTMVTKHYMHMAKMKKHRFIKNKVWNTVWKWTLKKPHWSHVTCGIDDLNEIDHAWMVWSQQHLNMTYKVPIPFTKYACCACEWALCGNLCKHQIIVLLHVPISLKNISFNIVGMVWIWSWRFCHHVADLTYLHIYDNEFDDHQEADEDHS
jgi:hypothetical protein